MKRGGRKRKPEMPGPKPAYSAADVLEGLSRFSHSRASCAQYDTLHQKSSFSQ